jgi:phosphoglycolate phosphatase-like HAD superfamily hydrolase
VLIDTNGVKSRAFYEAALPYGQDAAQQLVAYHQRAGSIGRDARWRYFFSEILHKTPGPEEFAEAMKRTSEMVRDGTAAAALLPGVREYLERLGPERCVVVSGIEHYELCEILKTHDLTRHFCSVWGGPRTKPVLLRDLLWTRDVTLPALYYGDVEDDYLSARNNGLDFVWVRGCSEWPGIRTIEDFRELA